VYTSYYDLKAERKALEEDEKALEAEVAKYTSFLTKK
jgi:hypothetical protein